MVFTTLAHPPSPENISGWSGRHPGDAGSSGGSAGGIGDMPAVHVEQQKSATVEVLVTENVCSGVHPPSSEANKMTEKLQYE